MPRLVAPSVLSADFANLQRDVEMLNKSEADWIHVDVMDGVFVPNISFGLPVCKAIHQHAQKPLDVHLMIVQPEKYLKDFKKAGAASISVHYEASPHLHRTVQAIKELDCSAGVAINPHTPVENLIDILPELDFVLLMTVNPGFGGQKFIENSLNRIQRLKAMIEKTGKEILIEVDGGVGGGNANQLVELGVDILVSGSYIFGSPNPLEAIASLKRG